MEEFIVPPISDEPTTMRKTYRELSVDETRLIADIKDHGEWLFKIIDKTGSCRESSIAKTKLEEAVMWAVKAVSR